MLGSHRRSRGCVLGVAVEDGDDEAIILRDSGGWSGCQDSEEHTEGPNREATEGANRAGHRRLVGGPF